MDTSITGIDALLQTADPELRRIGEKIIAGQRITPEEGIGLFEKGSLPFLGTLALAIGGAVIGVKSRIPAGALLLPPHHGPCHKRAVLPDALPGAAALRSRRPGRACGHAIVPLAVLSPDNDEPPRAA